MTDQIDARCCPAHWALTVVLGFGIGVFGCPEEAPPTPAEDVVECEAGTRCPCDSPFDCPQDETCVGFVCVPIQSDVVETGDEDAGPDLRDLDTGDWPTDPEDADEPLETDFDPDLPDDTDLADITESDLPVCEEDDFDQPHDRYGNDSCEMAIRIDLGRNDDLVLCPDDPTAGQSFDYWGYTVGAHHQASFFVETAGDLSVTLYDAACNSPPLDEAEIVSGGYSISLTTCGEQPVNLLVDGSVDVRTEYAIDVSDERLECIDDPYDDAGGSPPSTNNVRNDAAPIEPAIDYDLVFCDLSGEEDWFHFDLPDRGFRANIAATFDAEGLCDPLEFHLWREDEGAPFQHSTPTSDGASIATAPLQPGGYDIQVTNTGVSEGPYLLHLDLDEVADCSDFDIYHEPDDSEEAAQATGMPITFDLEGNLENSAEFSDLIMCEDDTADIFAVPMDSATLVTFDIEFSVLEDPLRVWVYPEGDEPTALNRLTARDGRFAFPVYSSEASTVFIQIQPGTNGQRNYYTILAHQSLCSFDRFELNNTPDTAYAFAEGTVNESSIGLCAEDDPVDWYRRPTGAFRNQEVNIFNEFDQSLEVGLLFAPVAPRRFHCDDSSDCDLDEVCLGSRGCVTPLISGTVGADDSQEFGHWTGPNGGDYLLSVAATDPDAAGDYGFRWSDTFVCPDDGFGSNHSQDSAYPITLPVSDPLAGTLCVLGTTEEDFFDVTLEANTQLNVTVQFEPGDQVSLRIPCSSDTTSTTSGLLSRSVRSGTTSENVCFRVKGLLASDANRGVVPYDLLIDTTGIPDSCTDDSFEPNDSFAEAAAVSGGEGWIDEAVSVGLDLSICGEDEDYFQFYAAGGDVVVANAMFEADHGDLDLELWGTCWEGSCTQLVAQTSTTGDGETVSFPITAEGTYVLGVLPAGTGLEQVYGLSIGLFHSCEPDDDPYEPNDSLETAAPDGPGTAPENLALCSRDSFQPDYDWFEYYLLLDDVFTADLTFMHYHGDLELALWYEGELVASSSSVSNSEHIEYVVEAPGLHQLEIYALHGRDNPYSLSVGVERQPCEDDRLTPNDSWESAPVISDGTFDDLVLCPLTEDWLAIDVDRPTHLSLTMLTTPFAPGDDIQLALYHQDDLPEGAPLLLSNENRQLDALTLDIATDGLGTYYARIFQPEDVELIRAASYTLEVHKGLPGACPVDRYEPNDDGNEAVQLLPNSEVAAWACDDDWYAMYGFAGQTVTATLDYAFSGGTKPLVALYLEPDGSPIVVPSADSVSHTLEVSSPLYIAIDDENSLRSYRLRVEAEQASDVCESTDPTEEDDTIDNATPLSGTAWGYLCDELDLFSISPSSGQDVLVELTYPGEGSPPALDVINSSEVVLGSGFPTVGSALQAWFTWQGGGSPYVRIADSTDAFNAPYRIEATFFGPTAVDSLEPNDSYDAPKTLLSTQIGVLLSNLSLSHQSDVDFYRFTGNSGRRVGAHVGLQESEDVIVRLYDPDGAIVMEANRSGLNRPKETAWTQAETTGFYTLEVLGPTPRPASYVLRVLNADDPACSDTGTNRSYDTAETITIGAGASVEEVCAGPGDWYRTSASLVPGQSIRIDVTHDLLQADLDIEIYRASDEIDREVHTLQAVESLTYQAITSGRVYFRVYADDGSPRATYQLSVNWGE